MTVSLDINFFLNFKSHIANDYGFKVGMYLEVEKLFKSKKYDFEAEKEKSFIAPAVIEAVNNNGLLLMRYEDTEETFEIEPFSPLLHPCGYWNYYSKNVSSASKEGKQFRIEPS